MMAELLYESNYYGVSSLGDSLKHYGIKNQKWGVRRFQYEDGILTPAGRARYDVGPREKTGKSVAKTSAVTTSSGGKKSSASNDTKSSVNSKLKSKADSKPVTSSRKPAATGSVVAAKGSTGSSGGHGSVDADRWARIQAALYALNPELAPVVGKKNLTKTGTKKQARSSQVSKKLLQLLGQKVGKASINIADLKSDKRLAKLLNQKVKRKIQNG